MRPFRWSPLTLALVTACGGDVGPVEISALPELALEETLRIGSVDDEATTLTWFRVLLVGPNGEIVTGHPQEHLIRIHAADGRPLAVAGGEGEGPGELKSPGEMGFVGDSIWVLDNGTYRFSYFALDGSFLGSRAISIDLGTDMLDSPPRPRGLLRDGSVYGSTMAWSHLVASGEITTMATLRMDETGGVIDTLAVQPLANTVWEIRDPSGASSFGSYSLPPFSDAEIVKLSRTRDAVIRLDRTVRSDDPEPSFTLRVVGFGGDTLLQRSYRYQPVRITDADVDEAVDAYAERFRTPSFPSAPSYGQAAEWARASFYRPAYRPPATDLVEGTDGTFWIRTRGSLFDAGEWLLLSPSGEAVGRVSLPPRTMVLAADASSLWGQVLDELDVPYIVRWRVTVD